MEFPAGKTLALIYRHPTLGERDHGQEARNAVLHDAHEHNLEARIVRRDFIEFANGFRVVFLDEDKQETQSRGCRFDEIHCFGSATYISDITHLACYTPRQCTQSP
jgi:hypothetical protein